MDRSERKNPKPKISFRGNKSGEGTAKEAMRRDLERVYPFNEDPKSIFPKETRDEGFKDQRLRGKLLGCVSERSRLRRSKERDQPYMKGNHDGDKGKYFTNIENKNERRLKRDFSECSISGDLKSISLVDIEGEKGMESGGRQLRRMGEVDVQRNRGRGLSNFKSNQHEHLGYHERTDHSKGTWRGDTNQGKLGQNESREPRGNVAYKFSEYDKFPAARNKKNFNEKKNKFLSSQIGENFVENAHPSSHPERRLNIETKKPELYSQEEKNMKTQNSNLMSENIKSKKFGNLRKIFLESSEIQKLKFNIPRTKNKSLSGEIIQGQVSNLIDPKDQEKLNARGTHRWSKPTHGSNQIRSHQNFREPGFVPAQGVFQDKRLSANTGWHTGQHMEQQMAHPTANTPQPSQPQQARRSIHSGTISNQPNSLLISKSSSKNLGQSFSNTLPFSSSRSGMINPSSGSTVRRSSGGQNSIPRMSGIESIDINQFRQMGRGKPKNQIFEFGNQVYKKMIQKNRGLQFPFAKIDSLSRERMKLDKSYQKMKTTGHSMNVRGFQKARYQDSMTTLNKPQTTESGGFLHMSLDKRNFSQQYSNTSKEHLRHNSEFEIQSNRFHPRDPRVCVERGNSDLVPRITLNSSRDNDPASMSHNFKVLSVNENFQEQEESSKKLEKFKSDEYQINIARQRTENEMDEYLAPPNINSNNRFLQFPNPSSQTKRNEGGRKSLFHNNNYLGATKSIYSQRRNTKSMIRSLLTEKSESRSNIEPKMDKTSNTKLFSMSSMNDPRVEMSYKMQSLGFNRGTERPRPMLNNQCSLEISGSRQFGLEDAGGPQRPNFQEKIGTVHLEKVNEEKMIRESQNESSFYASLERDSKTSNLISKISSKMSCNLTANLNHYGVGSNLVKDDVERRNSQKGMEQDYYDQKIFEFQNKQISKGRATFKHRHSLPNVMRGNANLLKMIKENPNQTEQMEPHFMKMEPQLRNTQQLGVKSEKEIYENPENLFNSKKWILIGEICAKNQTNVLEIQNLARLRDERINWEKEVSQRRKEFDTQADLLLSEYYRWRSEKDGEREIGERQRKDREESERTIHLKKRERMMRISQNRNKLNRSEQMRQDGDQELQYLRIPNNMSSQKVIERGAQRDLQNTGIHSRPTDLDTMRGYRDQQRIQRNLIPTNPEEYQNDLGLQKSEFLRNLEKSYDLGKVRKRKVRTINEMDLERENDEQNYKRIKRESYGDSDSQQRHGRRKHFPNKTFAEFQEEGPHFKGTEYSHIRNQRNPNIHAHQKNRERTGFDQMKKQMPHIPSKETMPTMGLLKSGQKIHEHRERENLRNPDLQTFNLSLQNLEPILNKDLKTSLNINQREIRHNSSENSDEILTSNFEELEKYEEKPSKQNPKNDYEQKKQRKGARIGRLVGRNIQSRGRVEQNVRLERRSDLINKQQIDFGLKRKSKRLANLKIREKIMRTSQSLLGENVRERSRSQRKNLGGGRIDRQDKKLTDSEIEPNNSNLERSMNSKLKMKMSPSLSKIKLESQINSHSPVEIKMNLPQSQIQINPREPERLLIPESNERRSLTPNLQSRVETQPRTTRRHLRRKKRTPKPNLSEPVNQPREVSRKTRKGGCKCKRSKCLKMYCDCFGNDRKCRKSCKCEDCCNNTAHELLRTVAKREILAKDPNAFANKIKKMKGSTNKLNTRGCRCQKTRCVKKYCECYSAGIGCSILCQCLNCANSKLEIDDQEAQSYFEKPQRRRRKELLIFKFFAERVQNLEKEEEMKKMNEEMRDTLGRVRRGLEAGAISGDQLRKCVVELGLSKEFQEYEVRKMLQLRGLVYEKGERRE